MSKTKYTLYRKYNYGAKKVKPCLPQFLSTHSPDTNNHFHADLDPLQFAYINNHSTDDVISTVLHFILSHLEGKNTYTRLLFIDFSSAFNAIISRQLVEQLSLMAVDSGTCSWGRGSRESKWTTSLWRPSQWAQDALHSEPSAVKLSHHGLHRPAPSHLLQRHCGISPDIWSHLMVWELQGVPAQQDDKTFSQPVLPTTTREKIQEPPHKVRQTVFSHRQWEL